MKKILIAAVVLVLAVGGAYAFEKQSEADEVTASSKNIATDPNDPQFNPMEFRFENYKDLKSLISALNAMFPAGKDRKEVEKILVEAAGAKGIERASKEVTYAHIVKIHSNIGYVKSCGNDWKFVILYDDVNRVQKLRFPCL